MAYRPRWRKVVAMLLLWPAPEAAITILCTPDDGCNGHPKHVEADFAVNKYLHTAASCWIYRPRWRKVVAQILSPVPEAAFTVLCNPDDGCNGHPKHVESDFAVNKYLHTAASCWIFRPRWRKFVAQILWPVPEAAFTVLCTPDDGCNGHPKRVNLQ